MHIHVVFDGRDEPYDSIAVYTRELTAALNALGGGIDAVAGSELPSADGRGRT